MLAKADVQTDIANGIPATSARFSERRNSKTVDPFLGVNVGQIGEKMNNNSVYLAYQVSQSVVATSH